MRVLQLNVVYRRGSTGMIVHWIHDGLKRYGHDSIVCYGRKRVSKEENVFKISSEFEAKFHALLTRLTGRMYLYSFFSTRKAISLIKFLKPDIVHVHCLNGWFINIHKLFDFLKEGNIRTVLTLHAEFMFTGNCGHSYDCDKWRTGCGKCPNLKEATTSLILDRTAEEWQRMKQSLSGFEKLAIIAVSEWLAKRARLSPIFEELPVTVIWNGVDTDVFRPVATERLKKLHKIDDQKVILHVTPAFSNPSKGGQYVLELARRLDSKLYKFIIVGYNLRKGNLPANVIPVMHTSNLLELSEYYSLADLTLLTSKRETFSLVTAESLCCGTPVVGFRAGGPEEIAMKDYSEFVNYDDIDSLEVVIKTWSRRSSYRSDISHSASALYSKRRMVDKYLETYRRLLESSL
ncbi:Glycosyl transferase group 1 [Mesotoga infera]|uniref:Glycosyl transferase group 1 n=1 Tax=Mesotoga infera TaxID=1236046 RepID=A0A7Z7LE15_9BACT|nr:glycosyltransferase [Mesotoga infera]SSC12131.1 Glycosyl transferase group 1 [Mesotoga infera]